MCVFVRFMVGLFMASLFAPIFALSAGSDFPSMIALFELIVFYLYAALAVAHHVQILQTC